MRHYQLIVIGGGPAGLAAAIQAREDGVEDILVLERDHELGGILNQCIHNGFGLHLFQEELTGPAYAERFIDQLKGLGIAYRLNSMVLQLTDRREVSYVNREDGYCQVSADAVILAMGCRERTRGNITIPGTRCAGIYTAGAAQRLLNIEGYMVGKKVVILGSGDIGLIMARRLTLEGAEVEAVVELLPYSGGLTRNIVQCLDDYHIPLYLSHTIVDVRGEERLEQVVVMEVDARRKPIPGTEKVYDCDTLLLSVGLLPENELSQSAGVQMDPVTGGPNVNELMETSIPGVFACGNVVHVHDIVDFVTQEARRAGDGAARLIKGAVEDGSTVQTKPGKGVRYIVPQAVRPSNMGESQTLFFRVTDVFKDKELALYGDDKLLRRIKKRHMAPGEMVMVEVTREQMESCSTLRLEVEG
ncbi:MAG TPA: FAD-dependent oxidoreductase [Candidatus Avoscillospira avistercoris]|mgnify:FL=1|uniref:FAD-dependent oxidoreductase n=1 Tax=Candidatus Avoscillospira avistercoris TaxID=2840707 RepID=A0A9D1FB24_9FIRM|nr:FAD-dependent oxidoreductase [Candidatus Avoscillospira avistercoris]